MYSLYFGVNKFYKSRAHMKTKQNAFTSICLSNWSDKADSKEILFLLNGICIVFSRTKYGKPSLNSILSKAVIGYLS